VTVATGWGKLQYIHFQYCSEDCPGSLPSCSAPSVALVTLLILREEDFPKKEDKQTKSKHSVQLELEEAVP